MKISANLLTLGKDPEVKFTANGMMVILTVAENHNRNVGTREEPEWKQIGTSWFDMVAYGDVANEIVETLSKGNALELVSGVHKWKNIGTKEEPDYRPSYVIYEFNKIEKKEKNERSSS